MWYHRYIIDQHWFLFVDCVSYRQTPSIYGGVIMYSLSVTYDWEDRIDVEEAVKKVRFLFSHWGNFPPVFSIKCDEKLKEVRVDMEYDGLGRYAESNSHTAMDMFCSFVDGYMIGKRKVS